MCTFSNFYTEVCNLALMIEHKWLIDNKITLNFKKNTFLIFVLYFFIYN